MTAVGEASRGVPDALVRDYANSVYGHHQSFHPAKRRNWQQSYNSQLVRSGAIVVGLAVAVAPCVRFGRSDLLVSELSYILISNGLVVLWLSTLALFRTRSRLIGAGHTEDQCVDSGTAGLIGFIAIAALVRRLELAREYLAITLSVDLVGLLLWRWLCRKVIARKRARGEFQTSVLVVGGARVVRQMAHTFFLPRFRNVIYGEMSEVGPRPPLRNGVKAYDGRVNRRLLVRPGVTGLWQVSGPVGSVVGRVGTAGPVVRRELVDDERRVDHRQDSEGRIRA